jgi:hypothetical protein
LFNKAQGRFTENAKKTSRGGGYARAAAGPNE